MTVTSPIARGPLLDLHRRGSATVELKDGWQVAVRYPQAADRSGNVLVDLSHWPTWEINGPETGAALVSLCGSDVPLRKIHSEGERHVYRLTPNRAIVFGNVAELVRVRSSNDPRSLTTSATNEALDVTGGWASLALIGPDAERILNKVTAVDLRERTLPVQSCCQGPIFGVNTLFGRFAGRFDLHVCSDSAEFFWDVLMDAGAEFGLRPAGVEYL
jgi:heterotetrameric sarcosine oxidase gamma subunit